jgi:putative FmdB family regulatory protein
MAASFSASGPPGSVCSGTYNFLFCVKGLAMPIYAYRCSACGHSKDVLQKLSDPALSTCPACGAEAFSKQVTAAGFQLKGSGWYVTDFRGGNSGTATAGGNAGGAGGNGATEGGKDSAGASSPSPGGSGDNSSSTSSTASTAAAAPAAGCGGSCACH